MARPFFTAFTLLVAVFVTVAAPGREWSDAAGQFTVEADLAGVDGTNVQLRRNDGTVISVPISRLSEADRHYLASQTAKSGEPALTLVKDGQAVSMIVTNGRPKDAQVQAAAELQQHIRLMSGATLPIVKENELPPDAPKTLILVGPSNQTEARGVDTSALELESFVVKTVGDALVIAGEDGGSRSNPRRGTLWAAYDFLQDELGCRWIWPGDIGRVVPHRPTVTVGELDISETPTVKIRGFRMTAQDKHRTAYEKEGLGDFLEFGNVYDQISADESMWLDRMRMGRSFKLSYGHAFTDWWEKYKGTDPEIFALQADGKRRPRKKDKPDFVKMCVSNPRLWEMQLEPIKKYAAQGATGLWLNACENDGSGGFCTCPACRAWDAVPNATGPVRAMEDGSDVDVDGSPTNSDGLPECLSDRYARWYNELAIRTRQLDPEARVVAYAYSRYRSPPTRIDHIEPNVWVGYVGFNAYPHPEDYRKTSVDEWFGWSRLGATVFLRSNSLFYFGEGAPYVASHQIAADTKFQIENGLRATDYDCLQGYWATSGPSCYVLARMLWDTEADPDQLLAEFYGAFGPMNMVVKEYFDYWETFTVGLGNNPDFFDLNRTEKMQAYPKFYTKQVFAEAQAILDRAKPILANATEDERQRFRNIELGLEHGRLMVAALQDGKTSNGAEGEALFAFRRKIAPRNVVNVYWTTSKEKRYRVFE